MLSAKPPLGLPRLAQWLPWVERLARGGGATSAIRLLRRAAGWRAQATRAFFELLLVAIWVKSVVVDQVGRARMCEAKWKKGFGR